MTYYWISLPYATFGIGAQGGVVREAAPIARWTVGKAIAVILPYFRRKGARIYDYQTQALFVRSRAEKRER